MVTAHVVYPHGAIAPICDGLWQVQGSLPMPLTRNMTIYRLPNDGGLLLYSVVALNDDGMAALERLGRPTVLVVPHPFHIMDAAFYKQRYPELVVVAPVHAAKRLSKNFPGEISVDFSPDEGLARFHLEHRVVPGLKYTEIVLDLPVDGGRALLFTDAFTATKPKGLVDRILSAPRGGVGLARMVRFRQVTDRKALRAFFNELAEIRDLRYLLTSHGHAITKNCSDVLRHAAKYA
jgi:hypothetical protein